MVKRIHIVPVNQLRKVSEVTKGLAILLGTTEAIGPRDTGLRTQRRRLTKYHNPLQSAYETETEVLPTLNLGPNGGII